jgi:hypothetical protein
MRLLERAFATTEEGGARLDFLPTGLRCVMRFKSELARNEAVAPHENAGPEHDRDTGFASRVDSTA